MSLASRVAWRVGGMCGSAENVSDLLFATSEALGDIGSSDVAVVVPKYRAFMNAGTRQPQFETDPETREFREQVSWASRGSDLLRAVRRALSRLSERVSRGRCPRFGQPGCVRVCWRAQACRS